MRQQLVTIAGNLAAILVFAGLLMGGVAAIRDRDSAVSPDFVLEVPDLAATEKAAPVQGIPVSPPPPAAEKDSPGQGAAVKSARLPVRSVEPGLFALPEDDLARPLERVAPRPPLSGPQIDQKPATIVLHRPVALAAGLVRSGDMTLQFREIDQESAEKVCGESGETWPCGMIARTAFRNFLRGRALVCDHMEEKRDGATVATCTVGGQNAAEWLATNGWAIALPGTSLEAATNAARKARRGFYGEDPRDLNRGSNAGGLQAGSEVPN
ncbi:Succinoglycan biosynthesis protein ExoI [Sinorhizobium sojae CCBAU 05684]|uniref:Succinoglycan biosynthesis protein ExoI n=1 Tax=Sinorhizobium sojae CCBAU 05684 TaxID=716928 RepID=A0A249P715_9HYPH|nr:thermonuclease family protein [Sinorhizobium sojae]ASY61606.1 Succinoglycan biosynthesis protein ExoI [Sinorhizobium sojae CCBAU 05684]